MKKTFVIILVFMISAFNSSAQDDLSISLAIKETLEKNLDIKISENYEEIAKNNSSILNNNYLVTYKLYVSPCYSFIFIINF